jgi:hypothetical protein
MIDNAEPHFILFRDGETMDIMTIGIVFGLGIGGYVESCVHPYALRQLSCDQRSAIKRHKYSPSIIINA